jgi:cell wall-associated NlpC family hydrolase
MYRPLPITCACGFSVRVVFSTGVVPGFHSYWPGGTRPDGFDCSGFVQYLYRQQGISLPRTTQAQFTAGTSVSSRRILPGDLVFFRNSGRRISHVGISLGDGRFMHAPNVGSHVRIDRLEAPYWARRFAGVRRVAP